MSRGLDINKYTDNQIKYMYQNGVNGVYFSFEVSSLIRHNEIGGYEMKQLKSFLGTKEEDEVFTFLRKYIVRLNDIIYQTRLSKQTIFYRGMTSKVNIKYGDYIVMKPFSSVSKSVLTAVTYTDVNGDFDDYKYLYEISVPENFHILPLGISENSKFVYDQQEFVFPLCTVFKVKKVTKVGNFTFVSLIVCYQNKDINYHVTEKDIIKEYKYDFIIRDYPITDTFKSKIDDCRRYVKYLKGLQSLDCVHLTEIEYNIFSRYIGKLTSRQILEDVYEILKGNVTDKVFDKFTEYIKVKTQSKDDLKDFKMIFLKVYEYMKQNKKFTRTVYVNMNNKWLEKRVNDQMSITALSKNEFICNDFLRYFNHSATMDTQKGIQNDYWKEFCKLNISSKNVIPIHYNEYIVILFLDKHTISKERTEKVDTKCNDPSMIKKMNVYKIR